MMQGRRIRVRGQVQGVGFRPFIWQLAQRFGLRGEVLNDPEGVLILAAGEALDAFEVAIAAEAPLLARVDAVESGPAEIAAAEGFSIAASRGTGAETRVTPDAATCPDCLAEIRDPGDRRYGYAFANCTHCGPRFTILRELPYDRAQTTMAAFEMCADCRAEYEIPPTAGSMPSPSPVRPAGRVSGSNRPGTAIRLPRPPRGWRGERCWRSRGWAGFTLPWMQRMPQPWRCSGRASAGPPSRSP